MMKSLWVTFSDPKQALSTIRVQVADPKLPRTFGVEVDHTETDSWSILVNKAIALATPMLHAWLEAQSGKITAPVAAKPDPASSELVFSAEEIEPFVDEMLARMVTVAECGIRLELTSHGTASTDCRHSVHFNPQPFLLGQVEAGLGRGLHEVGHIRYDQNGTRKDRRRKQGEEAFGTALLTQAKTAGGETLVSLLNLIMDRRSDDKQIKEFPGNANALFHRLGFLLPGNRLDANGKVESRLNGVSLACKTSVLSDFAYAIKKRTRARHAIVHRCVNIARKAIYRVNAHKRRYEHLLYAAKRILDLLRQHMSEEEKKNEAEMEKQEEAFGEFMDNLQRAINGQGVNAKFAEHFRQMMVQKLETRRRQTLGTLTAQLQAVSRNTHPGKLPVHTGSESADHKIIKVSPDAASYGPVRARVSSHVSRLREVLQRLSIPVPYQLQGLTRGEFDLEALTVLATGRSDCMKVDLQERKLDAAIAFVLDVSGSMGSLHTSKDLAVAFNEAILPFRQHIDAGFYAFNDDVFDCGMTQPNNGIASVKISGGTYESFAVHVAGSWLKTQRRIRKILITICDGSPSDVAETKKATQALCAVGILPIRILVGVHTAPRTYPVELFFDSWDELSRELAKLFEAIVRSVRTA